MWHCSTTHLAHSRNRLITNQLTHQAVILIRFLAFFSPDKGGLSAAEAYSYGGALVLFLAAYTIREHAHANMSTRIPSSHAKYPLLCLTYFLRTLSPSIVTTDTDVMYACLLSHHIIFVEFELAGMRVRVASCALIYRDGHKVSFRLSYIGNRRF